MCHARHPVTLACRFISYGMEFFIKLFVVNIFDIKLTFWILLENLYYNILLYDIDKLAAGYDILMFSIEI